MQILKTASLGSNFAGSYMCSCCWVSIYMVLVERKYIIAGSWIVCEWFTQLMWLNCLFDKSQLVWAAEGGRGGGGNVGNCG